MKKPQKQTKRTKNQSERSAGGSPALPDPMNKPAGTPHSDGVEFHTVKPGAGKGTHGARLWENGEIIAGTEGYVNTSQAESWPVRVFKAMLKRPDCQAIAMEFAKPNIWNRLLNTIRDKRDRVKVEKYIAQLHPITAPPPEMDH